MVSVGKRKLGVVMTIMITPDITMQETAEGDQAAVVRRYLDSTGMSEHIEHWVVEEYIQGIQTEEEFKEAWEEHLEYGSRE